MKPDALVGQTLDGRYQIVRVLGGGAMGCVYEAHHVGTNRRVAVKVISTGDAMRNEALVGRFHREARAAGAIESQHIAQVLDTGTDPATGHPFMVMEYLAGEDVSQYLQRVTQAPVDVALRIVAQVCIGLAKAHEARVVHRDIKPANLYLSTRDAGEVVVKLLDFGIAKIKAEVGAEDSANGLTRTGSMLGSPLYMSPEQARGSKQIDHRADIWSLGIVLYQALAGRTPWDEIEALGELIIAICSDAPTPVQTYAPWVPAEVAAIVHRALHYDREHRFQSATEMLDAIKTHLPSGHAIDTSMLVAISAEERSRVATRLPDDLPRATAPRRSGYPPPPAPIAAASVRIEGGGTAGGVSGQVARQPRGTAVRAAVGGVALLGLAGFGAVQALRMQEAPPPPAPVVAVEVHHPPEPPKTSEAPAVQPAPADRMVKLVVLPQSVVVEVNGAPVPVRDGVVEITGALGSVHKVKLVSGKRESIEDVVVTESGAMPPKLELAAEPLGGVRHVPKIVATAAPTAVPVTQPEGPPTGIERSFE